MGIGTPSELLSEKRQKFLPLFFVKTFGVFRPGSQFSKKKYMYI